MPTEGISRLLSVILRLGSGISRFHLIELWLGLLGARGLLLIAHHGQDKIHNNLVHYKLVGIQIRPLHNRHLVPVEKHRAAWTIPSSSCWNPSGKCSALI